MRLSPEISSRRALALVSRGGRVGRTNPWSRRVRPVTPGSENRANDHKGSPGTWETPSSPSNVPAGARLTNSGMILGRAPGAVGDEYGAHRWYRRAKETEHGETGGGESERLILASKRGNGPSGPRGAKGTPRRGPKAGSMPGTQSPVTCTHKADGSCEGQRSRDVTSRMP